MNIVKIVFFQGTDFIKSLYIKGYLTYKQYTLFSLHNVGMLVK